MSITITKTHKRTTIDTPWYAHPEDKASLVADWVTAGKMTATASNPDPLTKIINRTYPTKAIYDEWLALPAQQVSRTLEAVHDTTNGITWTKVVTDSSNGTSLTENSSDYSLSLSKS
jgi:hypothetical protein